VSDSATLRVDQGIKDRLDALAAARNVDPADLLSELVLQAETAQVVAEVNRELERLSQRPTERGREQSEMRRLEAAVQAWMRD
jgi:predicted transcriptional regulator